MAAPSPLRLDVSEILDRPGASRSFREHLVVPAAASRPALAVDADLVIEAIPDGLAVRGSLTGQAEVPCSRCLEATSVAVDVEVREAFLTPGEETDEDEAYPIDGGEIDLEPLIRETVVLGMPAYPRCAEDCPGLCPTCGASRANDDCECEVSEGDPRFAILAQLNLPRKDR